MSLGSFLDPLYIDDARLASLSVAFSKIFEHLAKNSTEQFLATPINVLPRGTETGRFLAIDVGGSNLRVGFVELQGAAIGPPDAVRVTHERAWSIEDHFKMDNAQELFAWIGSCIALVVSEYMADSLHSEDPRDRLGEVVPMGITFSFPMLQVSISEATLMPMGKGFAITSDLDLGNMLLAGYSQSKNATHLPPNGARHHDMATVELPEIKVVAITNDTVATLASLAYSVRALSHGKVAMGLIVGTGTNSSIVMPLDDLHESKRQSVSLPVNSETRDTSVVVNTEWTIKGAAPPLHQFKLVTPWDEQLDRECEAPGFQPFEYMTSGRYLGELARLILRDYLVRIEGADTSALPQALNERNAVPTLLLSQVVAQASSPRALLQDITVRLPPCLPSWQWEARHAQLFMDIAHALRLRSAKMIAAAAVGLLVSAGDITWNHNSSTIRQNRNLDSVEEVIIAYAGGVISLYPQFLETCQRTIDDLVDKLTVKDKVKRVVLRDANKGGILGAGVLAATVWNLSPASI